MKTFDEAMGHLMPGMLAKDATDEAVKKLVDVATDRALRHSQLVQEIMDDSRVKSLVDGTLEMMPVKDALVSIFINGVMVGMDMEKQELPKL